jgi:hypothetical protein
VENLDQRTPGEALSTLIAAGNDYMSRNFNGAGPVSPPISMAYQPGLYEVLIEQLPRIGKAIANLPQHLQRPMLDHLVAALPVPETIADSECCQNIDAGRISLHGTELSADDMADQTPQ